MVAVAKDFRGASAAAPPIIPGPAGSWLAVSVGVVLFSWFIATFPGEWQEDNLPSAKIFRAKNGQGKRRKSTG